MFSSFKSVGIPEVYELMSNPKSLKTALKKAPKNGPMARNLGLYYDALGQTLNAWNWLRIASENKCHAALADLAVIHFRHHGETLSDIINRVSFSNETALSLLETAIHHGVVDASSLKLRYLYRVNPTPRMELVHLAKTALTKKDDFARAVLMQSALSLPSYDVRPDTLNSSITETIEYLISLFDISIGGDAAFLCAKLMTMKPNGLSSPHLPAVFIGRTAMDYIVISANAGNGDALYLQGRDILLNKKDVELGENILRKALKKNVVQAGLLLADWLSQFSDRKQDAISLYKQCSSAPQHGLVALCGLIAHQDNGEHLGMDEGYCRDIIAKGMVAGLPIAHHLNRMRQLKTKGYGG